MNRSVFYLQYTNPANYPPLEQSGLILLKADWDVFYLGIQSEGESNKLVFPKPLDGCVKLWMRSPPGFRQKLHFLAFTLASVWRVFWERPSWVHCSDLMSCPAAWLIKCSTKYRVLYHEHDSPNEEQGKQGNVSKFQRFLLWTRKRVGQQADLVVLPNRKRLEFFQQATERQKPSLCVFNCPRLGEIQTPKNQQSPEGPLRLAFHGSINKERLPMAVLDAMGQFKGRIHLTVIGYETIGSKNYMLDFLQKAEHLGLREAVNYVGALPTRGDIFQHATKCHVGLAFMPLEGGDVNMANMTGASNKPFDYLACGLALLASARADWEEMFVRPGYARACNPFDADSIAEQLRWFLEHRQETKTMGEHGRERILRDWNYETQFAPVVEAMSQR